MNVSDMLTGYRAAAAPNMQLVAAEFRALSASEQRELLFWMIVDTATNPTHRRPPHGQPGPI
jgi:hypothetical protein